MIESIPPAALAPILSIGALIIVSRLGRLGPRVVRRLETVRGLVWRALHPLGGPIGRRIPPRGEPRDLVRDKTGSEEYVLTVDASLHEIETALSKRRWNWNPISTKKFRRVGGDGRTQWSVASWVYRDGPLADRQLHCYMFYNDAGGIDVFCHDEPNLISQPREHTNPIKQTPGDPDGRLRADLADAGLDAR